MLSGDGSAARFLLVLDRDPQGGKAIDRYDRLASRLPGLLAANGLGGVRASFAGETALASETVDSVAESMKRIAIGAILVNLLLLALFLRALVAPLYLVAASALGLAAALGLTTLVFQDWLNQDDLTYYVPLAAGVLLVSLGSDYNLFLVGRIWREARRLPLRDAISIAAPRASRPIRLAGLALASSFALLAIVPIDEFRVFAFAMAAGVLIDTLVVRAVLVPALIALFGSVGWWPRRSAAPPREPAPALDAEPVRQPGERLDLAMQREVLERVGLDLAHPLARQPERPADRLERHRGSFVAEPVAEREHAALALGQRRAARGARVSSRRLTSTSSSAAVALGRDQVAERSPSSSPTGRSRLVTARAASRTSRTCFSGSFAALRDLLVGRRPLELRASARARRGRSSARARRCGPGCGSSATCSRRRAGPPGGSTTSRRSRT